MIEGMAYPSVGATVLAAGLFAIGLAYLLWPDPVKFSVIPLGLKAGGKETRRKKKAHSVLCVKGLQEWEEWPKVLKRSPRRTLLNSVPAAFNTDGSGEVKWRTLDAGELEWSRHFAVVRQHEVRVHGWVRGFFAAVLRMTVARSMVGAVDEYTDLDGRVLAWAHTIIKGTYA